MARIAGVDLPKDKRIEIGLTYVYGIGRGTQAPFEIYGHPDMKDCEFTFTPRSIPGAKTPRYQDQLCHGVDLRGKPLAEIWDEEVNYEYVIDAYGKMNIGDSFFLSHNSFELRVGVGYIREMIENPEYSVQSLQSSARINASLFSSFIDLRISGQIS